MLPHRHSESQPAGVRPAEGGRRGPARVHRNDWTGLHPPDPGCWTPRLSVSTVVTALGGERLDLTLAALSVQTYPAHLLDVLVIAADGVALPEDPGESVRVERVPAGTGAAAACALGTRLAGGDILCLLDAGMIVDPFYAETHARWHHMRPDCVTLADVLSAREVPADAADTAVMALSGGMADALGGDGACADRDALLDATGDLAGADDRACRAFTRSACAVRTALFRAAAGDGPLGEAELADRLWTAGALFLPDRDAPAWSTGEAGTALPAADADRTRPPRVRAVVDIGGADYDMVRGCVDRLLDAGEPDIGVDLVADWEGERVSEEALLELRLVQAAYLADARVRFVPDPPRTGFPSPYLLQLPVAWGLSPDTLGLLTDRAERAHAGVVELVPESAPTPGAGVRLWRTRALARALRERCQGERLADAVAEVYGRYRIQAGEGTLVDLTDPEACHYRSEPLRTGVGAAEQDAYGDEDDGEQSADARPRRQREGDGPVVGPGRDEFDEGDDGEQSADAESGDGRIRALFAAARASAARAARACGAACAAPLRFMR
ncbi:glycosyl transferase family 2 [Nocardiopsis suaedae]|uniref:Glycosyl transferase family 2 n=1 Tax=Nocardiopsis suaedae TaxID=3018444 RepID=A0ABT4TTI9_9ACTN|nr:glycosyl transferase family 2 [Nocardiopsis suaedae]MDA2807952.1 glycosyl transferase family 2 [Nocardiopsis suaedae]